MKFLISGATGLVGTALSENLRRDRHEVTRLVRPGREMRSGDLPWNPDASEPDLEGAEGTDVVVHLAGASIADGRWTEERKRVLRTSRVDATEHLVSALARLRRPPKTLISASAIGYYGDRGEEILTEESAAGNRFLSTLARDW